MNLVTYQSNCGKHCCGYLEYFKKKNRFKTRVNNSTI
jgi:hypothetical protein